MEYVFTVGLLLQARAAKTNDNIRQGCVFNVAHQRNAYFVS
jgi:hypothetical protein